MSRHVTESGDLIMLRWALSICDSGTDCRRAGYRGLAGDFAYIAKILLLVFLVLFVVSLLFGRRVAPLP